jgi:hypothetical protein
MQSPALRSGATLVALLAATHATAADHFLVIGGGYEPAGNQVSLEKNVLLLNALLGEIYSTAPPIDLLFSDGEDPARDLQFVIPDSDLPQANLLLARIMRQTDALGETYRSHNLPSPHRAANRSNLDAWFNSQGKLLKSGDRLILYVTAHGGEAPKNDDQNTVLYLWKHEEIRMKELAKLLDSLPDGVKVVLIMVQCYSGGFANLAFANGNPANGPTRADICGFFATTHDRPAAGCTPDIDEQNYHEYSTYFWEAIRRRTRTGDPIRRNPDLDADGTVSFAEAHAYALLESVTVDLSIKTSDAFLRSFSRTGPSLWSPETDYSALLEKASTLDRAVLLGLSSELGLSAPNRFDEARQKADATDQSKKQLDRDRRDATAALRRTALAIERELTSRWPELKNRWNPQVVDLLTKDADTVVTAITSHPKYPDFEKQRLRIKKIEADRMDQDRLWVKCRRLMRTLENVALEANLPSVADSNIVDRYTKLIQSEAASLTPTDPTIAGRPPHSRSQP